MATERLYKKKGGKIWYGWLYDAEGKRISFCTRCTDRRAAVQALKQRERAAYAPGRSAKNAPAHRLEDALQYLVSESSADRAPATLEMYAKKGGHLLRLLGQIDVHGLTHDDVQAYINQRVEEGAKRTTVHKELCTLRRALTLARKRGLFLSDARSIVPEFRVRYEPRRRNLTSEEFVLLLANLDESRHLFVRLIVFLSPRLSEVRALRWENVNFSKNWVLIPGTKTRQSHRMVPLPAALRADLLRERRVNGPVVDPWNNVRRDLQVACTKAGIEKVTPNDLRRTFASWLKQAGVDSFTVGKLMGHTSSRMVELVYGHLNDAAFITAMAKMPTLPALPKPGSKWVADSGESPEISETHETSPTEKLQGFTVPRDGIEPPTRGFSSTVFPKKAPRHRVKAKKPCNAGVTAASVITEFSKRGVPIHPVLGELISRPRTKPRGELPATPSRHLPPIAQSTPMPLHLPKGPPRVTAPATEPMLKDLMDLKPRRDSLERAHRINALKHEKARRREERRGKRQANALAPVGDGGTTAGE